MISALVLREDVCNCRRVYKVYTKKNIVIFCKNPTCPRGCHGKIQKIVENVSKPKGKGGNAGKAKNSKKAF